MNKKDGAKVILFVVVGLALVMASFTAHNVNKLTKRVDDLEKNKKTP